MDIDVYGWDVKIYDADIWNRQSTRDLTKNFRYREAERILKTLTARDRSPLPDICAATLSEDTV
jgi:hypothetical protein